MGWLSMRNSHNKSVNCIFIGPDWDDFRQKIPQSAKMGGLISKLRSTINQQLFSSIQGVLAYNSRLRVNHAVIY